MTAEISSRMMTKLDPERHTGLVILDVDGVVLRNIFLIRIARHMGLFTYLKTLFLGWRYYTGSISFDTLLDQGIEVIRNCNARHGAHIARSMKKSKYVKETIALLKRYGYFVGLISSGIPDFILREIAEDTGADYYEGMHTVIEDGRIELKGTVMRPKTAVVEELLSVTGLSWDRVVSVADDPNNLSLIQKSSLGIGYNPSRIIRKNADIVVDGYNFLELIPQIIPDTELPDRLKGKTHLVQRELYRKFIHFLGVPLPFLAHMNEHIMFGFLLALMLIYSFSEVLRYIGFHVPVISTITKKARRRNEYRGFIIGPISLTAGILIPILFFPHTIYIPSILIVCISDVLSGLVGRRFGRIPLPFYKRTIEGSVAFFLSAFVILLFFVPPGYALAAALVPTVIETLSPYNLDNILIPVSTALFLFLIV